MCLNVCLYCTYMLFCHNALSATTSLVYWSSILRSRSNTYLEPTSTELLGEPTSTELLGEPTSTELLGEPPSTELLG